MTTLVALATKDALVMGCDSLGSVTKRLVDPYDLVKEYFDPKSNWKLKLDENGTPVLKEFEDIYNKSQHVPYNHMTHVTKLYSLGPLEMGVMTTGIASIGDRTIKSIINEFKSNDRVFKEKNRPTNYTVKTIGKRLLVFIKGYYDQEFSGNIKPFLEFMIGGYDKQKRIPTICRIYVDKNNIEPAIRKFGIAFGGQMLEIQRLVFGTDFINRLRLIERSGSLLNKYQGLLQKYLAGKKIELQLPGHKRYGDSLKLFHKWDLIGFDADFGDFSEQNAIECVDFFVKIMIKSQQFCSMMPTVGGSVRVALITKQRGFQFISREEYEHEGFKTLIEG